MTPILYLINLRRSPRKQTGLKPLSENTINKQMKHLLRKVGLSYEELQPDHGLRRFFKTTLMNSVQGTDDGLQRQTR